MQTYTGEAAEAVARLTDEFEFQRTNHALGKPVDLARLFTIWEELQVEFTEALKEAEADVQNAIRNENAMTDDLSTVTDERDSLKAKLNEVKEKLLTIHDDIKAD